MSKKGGRKSVPVMGTSPKVDQHNAKMPKGVKFTSGETGRHKPYGCGKTKTRKYS